jgi:site-specific DNA recombinase
MRAIGYVRVSTEDQAKEGVSLDAQEERIRAFCFAKGWELVGIKRDEGKSAKDLKRPGAQETIQGCQRKAFDVVVVYKLDRLTRNIRDLGFLLQDVFERYGVAFSSVQDNFDTTTASGKLVLNVMGSVAQWEREIIAERTREAMQFKRAKLQRVGAVPFGYTCVDGQLLPDEGEQAVLNRIRSLRRDGYSYEGIAERLNLDGVVAKNGGRWHGKTVFYIFKNPLPMVAA